MNTTNPRRHTDVLQTLKRRRVSTENLLYQVSPACPAMSPYICYHEKYERNISQCNPSFKHSLNISSHKCKCRKSEVNSALRHVKAGFRSMMGEERLNVLLLVCIHRDIFLDYDKIIDVYTSKYPRRMLLINPLSEIKDVI